MGQAANNRGRNATLDNKKQRAAGRGPGAVMRDFDSPQPGRGKTMGAFGGTGRGSPKSRPKKER